MTRPNLILILGDQLSLDNSALRDARPGVDLILMAEVRDEATYVRHNRHKIALIFSAMRHFREVLRERGFSVQYREFAEGVESLAQAVKEVDASEYVRLLVCEPGEYRLRKEIENWRSVYGIDVEIREDSRFLCSIAEFNSWADGHKQLRMEFFYRTMRKRYGLLLDEQGKPCGGKWNFDAENRKGWRNQLDIPARPGLEQDAITRKVLQQVEAAFPDNPGDLSRFNYPVTAEQAQAHLDWFCEFGLADFGNYQDALAEESPWLFHSLIASSINIGLLHPLNVCRQVEQAWRDQHCDLAAAEGFIRQILGWREYIHGVYWRWMPDYRQHNHFAARRPLPDLFWSGATDLRCLSKAIKQSLELGYGHHIQRLMVIGNFALLTGLDVESVCDWYLAVYVDAFEWVELPNTLGMALHADGGLMSSKPYAASGKYIQRQGNHCSLCSFDPSRTTGEGSCPYNSLYWRFIDCHLPLLEGNARMGLILNNWKKRDADERRAIVAWGDRVIEEVLA